MKSDKNILRHQRIEIYPGEIKFEPDKWIRRKQVSQFLNNDYQGDSILLMDKTKLMFLKGNR